MIVVIGQFRLPPERMEDAHPVMRRVMEATRAENGCVEYNYAEDLLDPGLIRVSELWHTREQLAAHMQTKHMADWQREREILGMTGRVVTVFEAGEGVPL